MPLHARCVCGVAHTLSPNTYALLRKYQAIYRRLGSLSYTLMLAYYLYLCKAAAMIASSINYILTIALHTAISLD